MRLPIVALLVLIALACGFGAGYMLGDNQSAPRAPHSIQPDHEDARNDRTPVAPAPETPVVAPRVQAVVPPDTTVAGAKTGNGRIWGTVTLPAGQPLEGVTLTAMPRLPGARRYAYDPSESDSVDEFLRWMQFSQSGKATAATDEEGRFELSGLGDYQFTVSAAIPGYSCQPVVGLGTGGSVRPDAEVHFVATPQGELELDVRLPDGTAPPSAGARLQDAGQTWAVWTWTPEHSRYSYREGAFVLSVTAGENREFTSRQIEVDLIEGELVRVTVQLSMTPGIACRVHLPASFGTQSGRFAPVRQVSVHLVANPGLEPPDPLVSGNLRRESLRGGNVAHFNDLQPGEYRVIAVLGGHVLAWKNVTVQDRVAEVDLHVEDPAPEDHIAILVEYPDGERATDARVTYSRVMSGSAFGASHGYVVNRGNGEFWIRRVPEGTPFALAHDWDYQVEASAPGYGTVAATCPSGHSQPLTIRLLASGELTVEFPGAFRADIDGRVGARLIRVGEDGARTLVPLRKNRPMSRTGPDTGALTWAPTAAGQHEMFMYLAPHNSDADVLGSAIGKWLLDVGGGPQTRTVPVPALFTLTIVATGPSQPQRIVSLDGLGERGVGARGEDHTFVLTNVPAGDWAVVGMDGQMRVAVSGNTQVRYEPVAWNCLQLRGIRERGPLAALGLRHGDLLLAVDGQGWSPEASLLARATASYKQSETVWTIQRSGVRMDVTFDGRLVQQAIAPRQSATDSLTLVPAVAD